MDYGYKTLILLDNSASVSMPNREIVKETLKYLIRNAPESDTFALATFSEQTELLVDYGRDYDDYADAIDKISFMEKQTCMTDVLMQTLKDWEEGDFAMRNILLITDGMGHESTTYPIEELYFRLNEDSYPVYVLALSQQTNEMLLKRVGSLARISHGQIFYSEFEGSDAEVERQLSEQIYEAMNLRRQEELAEFPSENQPEQQISQPETIENEIYEYDTYYAQPEEEPESEVLMQEQVLPDYKPLFMVGAFLAAALLVLTILARMAGRGKYRGEHPALPQNSPMEITLEDLNNPMRYYHLPPMERILLGSARAETDVCVEDDEDISDKHCEIHYHSGRYYVRDLNTKSGTFLNGQRLYQETELHSSDVITLGHAKMLISITRFAV